MSKALTDVRPVAVKNHHAPGNRRVPLFRRMTRAWQLYAMVLPALIWVIIFCYIPMYGVTIAFKDFSPVKGLEGSPWVGLKHFTRFVTSDQFWTLMENTLVLALYELLVTFPTPIILALALNAVRQKYFSKVVQLVTYAPHFISTVVIVGIMSMLLNPNTGVANHLLELALLGPIDFMGDPAWFRTTFVFSGAWQTAGFSAIIYLAALSSVPPELHEAATVDGASRFKRMIHVDLPAIFPIAVIMLILNIGSILSVGFEKVLLMQNTLNLDVAQVIDTYVYQIGLQSPLPQFSYATAIGLFRSVVGMILLVLANWFARRITKSGLF